MSGNELCDFVWQHQYNKKWVTYSDKENELLNKAVKKHQKTLTLPSKDEKKKIVVYLDEMYQKNQVSSFEQEIRCLIYSDNFYSWLWKDGKGNWCSYKPQIVFFLEVAYQRNERIFKFYDQADYLIDLGTLTQKNEMTKYTRPVLREKAEIALTLKTFNLELQNEEFKKMCLNESLNFGKRCINLPSLSSASCSMSNNSQQINIPSSSLLASNDLNIEMYESNLPVDIECPNRHNFHIYCEGGTAFSATLSFSSVPSNNNKFCTLQILEHNKKEHYALFQRLGRVGSRGITKFLDHGSNISNSKAEFEARFYEKTKNCWSNKNNFVRILGKYDLLHIDLSPEIEKTDAEVDLDPSVQSLLEMICDRKTMADIMNEMSYDSNTPLGKLTLKQIKEGYIALNKIAQVASQDNTGRELVNACDEFYTKIPHNFGPKCPPIIRTQKDIEEKLRMLETLSNIRIATKTLNAKSDVIEHPLNKYYNSLNCALESLDPNSEEYAALTQYLKDTHGPTHTTYTMEIIDVFTCSQKKQSSLIDVDNKLLLWHGSRTTNYAGILKGGLRIAPPEAPSTGSMFGKGLYFADISSKSANYCFATKKNNIGLLLLCEVDVGSQLHLIDPLETLPGSLPDGYNSVVGKGNIIPSDFKTTVLSLEAQVPVGPLVELNFTDTCLHYNEYVVYDANLVKMKYLLRIQFNFK